MIKLFSYDQQGYWTPLYDVDVSTEEEVPKGNFTTKPVPQPCWKPIYQNGEWIETIAQEEIDAPVNAPQPKSELDLLKDQSAELNLQVIDLWETLIGAGVI